jgi:hypothetical protein
VKLLKKLERYEDWEKAIDKVLEEYPNYTELMLDKARV